MKTHRLGESSIHTRPRRRASESPKLAPRETIVLGDPTDCLLDAYDCISQRAYDNFLANGPRAGGELHDWLEAERQLLQNFPIDIHESGNFIYALASVPGATAARISIGIESRWMVILFRRTQDRRDTCACVKGLPAAVDAARSIAVLAAGVLGIRMAKK